MERMERVDSIAQRVGGRERMDGASVTEELEKRHRN